MYGGSGWIGEGIRIVVGCICRNVGAVEIVDGFAEGEFLVVGIGEVGARSWIVGVGLLTVVAVAVVML